MSLFSQGLIQVLEASVTGLAPKQSSVLALSRQPHDGGASEPLVTNPAGAAILNAVGPIRQIIQVRKRRSAATSNRKQEEAIFRRRQDDLDAAREAAQASYVKDRQSAVVTRDKARAAYRKAGGEA